ncbi:MAG: peptidylprolyl isomerase [bacterium]
MTAFGKTLILALVAALGFGRAGLAQREAVDRIVAVVGDEVILASELGSQVQWYVFQTKQQPQTESELQELHLEILDQMVSDRLFLIAAKQDTSVSVRPEEIDQALNERIAAITENFPSHDDFLQALQSEGLTLRDLRRKFRSEVENQLLKQRFVQRRLYSVSVSRHEVEAFYDAFKDSIPDQPEAVKLAHIVLPVKASPQAEDSVREAAEELRRKILDGADFAAISAQYSSLGAGANGGDLGFVSPSDVVEEFSRAAFKLGIGDVSGVVRTEFGYHIIRCEDKRGEQAHLRHVLLAVAPSAVDSARAYSLADSLMQAIQAGASFDETAKTFSVDDDTRAQGGELGWFALANLPKEFQSYAVGWQTVDELKGPIASPFGLHILKLLEYQPARSFTIDDDFDRLKELARQDKTGRVVDEWVEDLKKTTYIELRPEG